MYCPLQVAAYMFGGKELSNLSFDCTREKCAWWQEDDEVCYVVQIGLALSAIATESIAVRNELQRLANRSFKG